MYTDALNRLRDMLNAAREAMALWEGRATPDLASDRVRGLALIKLIEVTGEARHG